MKFAEDNRDYLLTSYETMSTYTMAKELGTYPNKINRALKYLKVPIRTKSEAQSQAIASGRHEHPTKGKKRSEETKIKISEAVYKYWQNMSDEEHERRKETSRIQWENMPDHQKENLRKLAADAVRLTAKNGSKMELFLHKNLTKHGYDVILHKKGLVVNTELELDLFLPSMKVVIEVDGPAHFFPVWGQESLDRHIKADANKAGLLLQAGYCVIRIKHLSKTLTEKHKRDVLAAVKSKLGEITVKFPEKTKRYIELEVK